MFLLTNNNIQWEEDSSSHSPKQSLQYRFSPHDEPAVPSGSPKKKQIPFSLHGCSCLTAGPVPASSGYAPIPFHTEPKNDTARDDSAAASATGSDHILHRLHPTCLIQQHKSFTKLTDMQILVIRFLYRQQMMPFIQEKFLHPFPFFAP